MRYDYCVVGGGIVGLATAMAILDRQRGASLRLIDKEGSLGRHQTGHNSGVIHSGIYYTPGSLKARLCREGAQATKDFAAHHGIRVDVCGKLLVATDAAELTRMEALYARSHANDVEVEHLGAAELHEREPNVRGVGALFVPATGIVDYSAIAEVMGEVVRKRGGELTLGAMVTDIAESGEEVALTLTPRSGDVAAPESDGERVRASRVVVCAGLTMSSVGVLLLLFTTDADRGADSAALQLSDTVTTAITTGIGGVLIAAAAGGLFGYTTAFTVLFVLMALVAVLGLVLARQARPPTWQEGGR